jgi:hypothetical protein
MEKHTLANQILGIAIAVFILHQVASRANVQRAGCARSG